MLNDVRYSLRNLRRAPGLTLVIVLTLAIGIGANTAIFSVLNALLFDPLPYPEADRLAAVTFDNDTALGFQMFGYPKYAAFAKTQSSFESTAAYATANVTVRVGELPERVEAEIVPAAYFPLLRLAPAAGRVFRPDEDAVIGQNAVIVISDAFWRRALGSDPGAVGKTLMIKDRAYEIVGVMSPAFRGQTGTAEVWIPASMAEHAYSAGSLAQGGFWWLRIVGRLKPGVSIEEANAAMTVVSPRVAALAPAVMPDMRKKDGRELLKVVPFKRIKVDPDVSRAFVVLLVAVGFVLLIACANTANLLLGRAVTRQREFAVRRAVGASGGRLARQVLIEGLIIAVLSAGAGILVALWGIDWLTTAKPWYGTGVFSQYARTFEYFDVSLEPRALAFNFAIAMVVGLVFGAAPAWHAARGDVTAMLKEGADASTNSFLSATRGMSARAALVLTEIVFSMVLLVAAGLMTRSFARIASMDLGFDADRLVTMTYTPSGRKPVAFYQELLTKVQATAGVDHAALSLGTPFGPGGWRGPAKVEGRAPNAPSLVSTVDVVTPDFFATYRIRLIAGRPFTDADRDLNLRVAIVNRAFAEAAWPGQAAIGKRVTSDLFTTDWMEVVGVTDHVIYGSIEEGPTPWLYIPAWQPRKADAVSIPPTSISLRTSVSSAAAAAPVREILHSLDPRAPLYGVVTLNERAAKVTSRYRFSSALMGGMALLALALAATGTYGVIAYSVSARTREIGIRMALGASPIDVVRTVVGGGLVLAGAGIALGIAGAYAGSRVLTSLLFRVEPGDPVTFAFTGVLMALVAAAASYVPARRAVAVDPVVALRSD